MNRRRMREACLAMIYVYLACFIGGVYGSRARDAVKLEKIKALTFHSGKLTTSRRVSPISQLSCVGGSAQGIFEPESIRCQNSGSSYSSADVQWTCQASLPPEFKLGSTDVICEGYDNAEDDYVLKGSCGLEYRLILTDVGEKKFGRQWFRAADRAGSEQSQGFKRRFNFESLAFALVFIGVAVWMIYAAFFRHQRRPPTTRGPRSNRRGGGPDDDNDPPPPYDPKPTSWFDTYSGSRASNFSSSPRSYPQPQNQRQGWRPGFWTGLGTGLGAGAAMNAYGRRRDQQRTAPSWRSYQGLQHEQTRSNEASASQTYSTERYTSTGFGGTRRR